MGGRSFQDHVTALTCLYEELQAENASLRSELTTARSVCGPLRTDIFPAWHCEAGKSGPDAGSLGEERMPFQPPLRHSVACPVIPESQRSLSKGESTLEMHCLDDSPRPVVAAQLREGSGEGAARHHVAAEAGSNKEERKVAVAEQEDGIDLPKALPRCGTSPSSRDSPRSSRGISSVRLPDTVVGKQLKRCSTSDAVLENMVMSSHCDPPQQDIGVISPVSPVRLVWDALAATFLLCEMWTTPVNMVFFADDDIPHAIEVFGVVSTIFFFADIFLNFNTGYLDDQEKVVLRRRLIIKSYLKCWFWLDLVATIPFDSIDLEGNSGSVTPFLRFGKVFKILKNVRYLKVVRTVRLAKRHSASGASTKFTAWVYLLGPCKCIIMCLKVLFPVSAVSHCLGCFWALARSSDSEFQLEPPMTRYFESFWWAFVNLMGGVLGAPSWVSSHNMWAMDLFVVCVRLLLLAVGLELCITRALVRDTAVDGMKERALQYLRSHKVRFAVQLQVMQCINETGQVRKVQKAFKDLMSQEIPPTIRGTVSEELWRPRLLTFEIFKVVNQWNQNAIRDLSLGVREEVLASQVILFKEGDPSPSAFNIIHGWIKAANFDRKNILSQDTPIFTDGMWVGEMALFNPLLLRSVSVVTQKMTTLMVVCVSEFHSILKKHGLEERLISYCRRHLWKGVCARCGRIGDHWPTECPTTAGLSSAAPADVEATRSSDFLAALGRTTSKQSVDPVPAEEAPRGQTDRWKFLECQGLEFLVPHLNELGVLSLAQLEEADLGMLNARILDRLDGEQRVQFEGRVFSAEMFEEFHEIAEASVLEILQFGKSRSQHLLFLSHYKVEAGTEAALIRSEIQTRLGEDPGHMGNRFDEPVFLDSENLRNLDKLRKHVQQSHNLVVLLTENILTRPWCLIEVVTAVHEGIDLVPVNVGKPGQSFQYPSKSFYQEMCDGKILDEGAAEVLHDCGIDLKDVCLCIQEVFKRIALPYEPHASTSIREAQVKAILSACNFRGGVSDESTE